MAFRGIWAWRRVLAAYVTTSDSDIEYTPQYQVGDSMFRLLQLIVSTSIYIEVPQSLIVDTFDSNFHQIDETIIAHVNIFLVPVIYLNMRSLRVRTMCAEVGMSCEASNVAETFMAQSFR
jgi:hypothetical protein